MVRPFDKHISNEELNALVPSSAEPHPGPHGLPPYAVREAEHHVESCVDCSRKVERYRQLVNRSSNVVVSVAAPPGTGCPRDADVDWHEVAAGLWPELRTKQLLMHAALCDHCGPLLRAAASMDDPTPQEEKLLAELKVPSRPGPVPRPVWSAPPRWQFMRWLVPAVALMAIFAVLSVTPSSYPAPLSGPKFAELAVRVHRQHAQGNLALDVRSDSQQTLNEWLKAKSPFYLALPASPAVPGEERPYRLEGARLVQVRGKTAAYVSYQAQTGPVGLIVAPDSLAIASGGVEADFNKLRFHYAMVEGYKVVSWSVHGLTYALVSQEGNSTQRSCMVCHSSMGDRDLTQTPTPLRDQGNAIEPVRE